MPNLDLASLGDVINVNFDLALLGDAAKTDLVRLDDAMSIFPPPSPGHKSSPPHQTPWEQRVAKVAGAPPVA